MKEDNYIKLYNDCMYMLHFGYNMTDVILLCNIMSLSQKTGECRVRDEWFMNYLNVGKSTVQNSLKKLADAGIINKGYDGNVRVIKVNKPIIKQIVKGFEYSRKLE